MRFSFLRMASMMAVTVLLGIGCTDDEKKDLDEGQKSSSEKPSTAPEGVVAVDLGLSVKWASCNVGATKPEEYGDYFAWGDTTTYYEAGYAEESPQKHWKEGKSSGFSWSSYKWCNGSNYTMTKYCNNSEFGNEGFTDTLTVLTPEDDVAHVKWGGSWRMPTKAEQDDLRNKCTWTWYSSGNTEFNGVAGYKVTSNIEGYTERFIFLPAAGFSFDKYHHDYLGSKGGYWSSWSSALSMDDRFRPDSACSLNFSSSSAYFTCEGRFGGRSVRPVCQ